MRQTWKDRAICHGVPEESYTAGTWEDLPKLQEFIEDYCMFCPVAQECLDDSWSPTPNGVGVTDDMFWVVRGGYLPTAQALNQRGRPRNDPGMPVLMGGRNNRPVGPNGFVLCHKNLHEMSPENVSLRSGHRRCKPCLKTRKRDSKRSKCSHGHKWEPGTWVLSPTGKRQCLTCADVRASGLCTKGLHEMTPDNIFSNKRGRFCVACLKASTDNPRTVRDATIEE